MIAASSHSWSPRLLCTRTSWSFDSNRITRTKHPIARMIGRSQFTGRNHPPKDPAMPCNVPEQPRDITAYKKGLMLARQAAQPSCQLRWCGGGGLGNKITCVRTDQGAALSQGERAHFFSNVDLPPLAKPF